MSAVTVAVCGPPHSGKSVFLGGLVANIPRKERYLFRACPDGEGTWTWRSPEAAKYRRKGAFRKETVDWYIKCLSAAKNLAPIVLVDLGGKMSAENCRILTEGRVDHALILSGDKTAIQDWEKFVRGCGVRVLARIHSHYEGISDDPDGDPLIVHRLERGEDVSSRPTIQQVAENILKLVPDRDQKKEEKNMGKNMEIEIAGLAEKLAKNPETRTLPNGRVVEQIIWRGDDLPQLARMFHNISGDLPEVIDIDGPAPAWLVAALCHELHPRQARVNSPDGFVPVGCRRPEGSGSGENLEFLVSHGPDGWLIVTCQQKDPSIPLSPNTLGDVRPPEVPMGAKIILSGRMPNWLAASLAVAYHGRAKAVALYQPGTGATVAWTHSQEVPLGEVVQVDGNS